MGVVPVFLNTTMGLLPSCDVNYQDSAAFYAVNRAQTDAGKNNIITDNKISSKTMGQAWLKAL